MENRENPKTFVYNREQDQKYVSVEIRLTEEDIKQAYDIADLARRLNPRSNMGDVRTILEWAVFRGLLSAIEDVFQDMADGAEIDEETFDNFRAKWETASYEEKTDPWFWGRQ